MTKVAVDGYKYRYRYRCRYRCMYRYSYRHRYSYTFRFLDSHSFIRFTRTLTRIPGVG